MIMEDYQKIVSELNQELFDRFEETELCFSYSTNGVIDSVSFEGRLLWDSENDGRKWDEETNDYEPFKPFIIRQYSNWVKRLNSIKLSKKK